MGPSEVNTREKMSSDVAEGWNQSRERKKQSMNIPQSSNNGGDF